MESKTSETERNGKGMKTLHEMELQQLLSNLVRMWPDDHNHPVVLQAREYLEAHRVMPTQVEDLSESHDPYSGPWYAV